MSDYVVSVIRTIVPALVGLIIAGLANVGIDIDQPALEAFLTSLIIGAWYALARWLEANVSWLKWINGYVKAPTYEKL